MSTSGIPYTLNECSITFFINGKQSTLASDHPNFDEIVIAVMKGDPDGNLRQLIDPTDTISEVTFGRVTIKSGEYVYCDDQLVPDYLANRILMHISKDFPVEPLIKFAEKLMENPNADVRNDLYTWLERGNMPIYPDGDFVAYKLVKHDFTPFHPGDYGQDQSPGQEVTMPRELCNENRYDTCSTGLHFCSYEYLPTFNSWHGGRLRDSSTSNKVILLKINPRDVVAIPTDYNLSKGRCCRFLSIQEIMLDKIAADFGDKLVLTTQPERKTTKTTKPTTENNNPAQRDAAVYDLLINQQLSRTEVAKTLGISRSTVGRALHRYQARLTEDTPFNRATKAIQEHDGNKTAAAKSLGIPRSTLYRWLAS